MDRMRALSLLSRTLHRVCHDQRSSRSRPRTSVYSAARETDTDQRFLTSGSHSIRTFTDIVPEHLYRPATYSFEGSGTVSPRRSHRSGRGSIVGSRPQQAGQQNPPAATEKKHVMKRRSLTFRLLFFSAAAVLVPAVWVSLIYRSISVRALEHSIQQGQTELARR